MIMIVQTSDGAELQRFDDQTVDAAGLSGDRQERLVRICKMLTEALRVSCLERDAKLVRYRPRDQSLITAIHRRK